MLRHPHAHITRFAAACGLIAALLLCGAATALAGIGSFTTRGAWSFVSAPALHPPKLRTDKPTARRGLASGYFMVANFPNIGGRTRMVGNGGPLILDSHLQPVWVRPVSTSLVGSTLREQTYNGKPVLSWWEGVVNSQGITTSGEDIVVDQHYRQVATLKGADGWVISEHEMVIRGHNAWVTAYKNVSNAPGAPPNVTVVDTAVQEYDLTTGKLLYTWDALQHIPLSASYQPAPKSGSWDAYHENSIQLVSGNRFLVSMRQEWAAYLVSATTGAIQWTLGGKNSSFRLGRGAVFEWQHDVELHGNKVTLFDDHCCQFNPATRKFVRPDGFSRALVLTLNTSRHTATQTLSVRSGRNGDATFLGNTQPLPNGNLLVSWGNTPWFSEYSRTGKLLLEVMWPGSGNSNQSYRAYLANWSATPFYPPNGALRTRNGKTTVYASWNGATQVAAWRVLGGSNSSHLATVVNRASRTGFETAIPLPHGFGAYKVQALDSRGRVIGTSSAFSAHHSPPPNPGGGFY
jgi:hypothetical protein